MRKPHGLLAAFESVGAWRLAAFEILVCEAHGLAHARPVHFPGEFCV